MREASSFEMTIYAKEALPLTIQRALRQPFYRSLWGDGVDESIAISNFESLPIVSKEDLQNYEPVLDADDRICSISHSTGTGGLLSYRIRSDKELRLINEFRGLVTRPQAERRIRVVIPSSFHGTVDHGATDRSFINIACSMATDGFVGNFIHLLKDGIPAYVCGGQVASLVGSLSDLQIATRIAQDAGLNKRLGQISTFGGYLTRYWRSEMENTWGVTPVHSYSASEISGGAIQCPKCGFLAFIAHVLPNIRWTPNDTYRGRPVGRLNLTELLPYGYAQPLIKFDTGDIVEKITSADACCAEHESGIRHLGRDSTSVWWVDGNKRELVIPSNEIHELFDLPFMYRDVVSPQLHRLRNRSQLGAAKASFEVAAENSSLQMAITTRFATDFALDRELLEARAKQITEGAQLTRPIDILIREDNNLQQSITK